MTTIKYSTALSVTLLALLAAIAIVGLAAKTTDAQTVASSSITDADSPSSIAATSTASGATIQWITAKVSTSEIAYGTSTSYTETKTGNLALDHNLTLGGLAPDTTYHYAVSSDDGTGALTSPDQTFTTSASSSAEAPDISGIMVIPTYSIATVIWNTDQPANSEVFYGISSNYGTSTIGDASLATSTSQHMVSITDLSPATTYHYAIVSSNALGVAATSSDGTFTTTAIPAY